MESEISFESIFWFLDEHFSIVANVHHISTGCVYPRFHLVFDDLFASVILQGDNDSKIEVIYSDIFDINRYWYAEDEFYDAKNIIYWLSPLHNFWIDERDVLIGNKSWHGIKSI